MNIPPKCVSKSIIQVAQWLYVITFRIGFLTSYWVKGVISMWVQFATTTNLQYFEMWMNEDKSACKTHIRHGSVCFKQCYSVFTTSVQNRRLQFRYTVWPVVLCTEMGECLIMLAVHLMFWKSTGSSFAKKLVWMIPVSHAGCWRLPASTNFKVWSPIVKAANQTHNDNDTFDPVWGQ